MKINQSQKNKYCLTPLVYEVFRGVKFKMEGWLLGLGERRMGCQCLMSTVSVLKDKGIQGMDGDNGGTAM